MNLCTCRQREGPCLTTRFEIGHMDFSIINESLDSLTAPFPAVMFCRAPTAASWVWGRTLQAISDRYMRTVMALQSHSMPRGFAFSSSRGLRRSRCCGEKRVVSCGFRVGSPGSRWRQAVATVAAGWWMTRNDVHLSWSHCVLSVLTQPEEIGWALSATLQHHHTVTSHNYEEFILQHPSGCTADMLFKASNVQATIKCLFQTVILYPCLYFSCMSCYMLHVKMSIVLLYLNSLPLSSFKNN